jgi:hypothetical protein
LNLSAVAGANRRSRVLQNRRNWFTSIEIDNVFLSIHYWGQLQIVRLSGLWIGRNVVVVYGSTTADSQRFGWRSGSRPGVLRLTYTTLQVSRAVVELVYKGDKLWSAK